MSSGKEFQTVGPATANADVHRYRASAVEQRLHDYWQNVAVDDRQRRILMCSGPSGTEELERRLPAATSHTQAPTAIADACHLII